MPPFLIYLMTTVAMIVAVLALIYLTVALR